MDELADSVRPAFLEAARGAREDLFRQRASTRTKGRVFRAVDGPLECALYITWADDGNPAEAIAIVIGTRRGGVDAIRWFEEDGPAVFSGRMREVLSVLVRGGQGQFVLSHVRDALVESVMCG